MGRPYSILLADDHIGFRREVRKILEEILDVQVTGEAGNRHELFERLHQAPPKLLILDIFLPDLRAGEAIPLIKLHCPGTEVLVMVMDQEPEYLDYGLSAGAAGILPKQEVAGQIARAIQTIRQGKIYIPPRAPRKKFPCPAASKSAGVTGTTE